MFKKQAKNGYQRNYQSKIVIHRDRDGAFYWRLLGSNGREIAESTAGYADKQHCKEAVERLRQIVADAVLVETADVL